MIDVEWVEEQKTAYNVDIEIYANDRNGLLADIIKEIGNTKAKLIAVNSRANKEKIAFTEITLELENLDELNKVLKLLRKVDSVYEVKRKK
jgi:GTP pyrophosphokinase